MHRCAPAPGPLWQASEAGPSPDGWNSDRGAEGKAATGDPQRCAHTGRGDGGVKGESPGPAAPLRGDPEDRGGVSAPFV